MQKPKPTVRANYPTAMNVPIAIAPAKGNEGCVVVEEFTDSKGNPRLHVVVYAGDGQKGVMYTPTVSGGSWLVDLPYGFPTPRSEIRAAIAAARVKPDPPPPWGHS
jgi:hypothetical protein